MKLLAAILAIMLVSCGTTLETRTVKFHTFANARTISVGADGSFAAADLNHSTPTRAAFTGASHLVSSVASGAVAFHTGAPVALRAVGAVPAIIPAFRTGGSTQ